MSVQEAGSKRRRELLGVYRDRETAETVVRAVAERAGDGRVGDADDYVAALRGEMRQEASDAVIAPQAGLALTKEATKGLTTILPVAILIGIIVCLPIVLIFGSPVSVPIRILIGVGIGVAGGGTIGFIAGGALGMRGPDDPAAAQRGVTVRAWPDRREIREVMVAAAPLRLDVVDETGQPIETVTTEHQGGKSAVEEVVERVEPLPSGDWSPVQADDPRHGRSQPGQDAPMNVPED